MFHGFREVVWSVFRVEKNRKILTVDILLFVVEVGGCAHGINLSFVVKEDGLVGTGTVSLVALDRRGVGVGVGVDLWFEVKSDEGSSPTFEDESLTISLSSFQ